MLLAVKNLLGLVLLAAGLAMMVLPGQGIITILIALTLLNFPGRRRLELYLIRQRHVRGAVDWNPTARREPAADRPRDGRAPTGLGVCAAERAMEQLVSAQTPNATARSR